MPKKGENSKAVEARERKAAVNKATADKVAKEKEDALWADDDKQLAKKKKQKEDEEKKRQDQLRKKAEAKELLEREMNSIQTTGKQPLAKITRTQIQAETESRNRNIETINAPKVVSRITKQDPLLEENTNHFMRDVEVATNVEEAIAVLKVVDIEDDKHPEKRMRAAYKAFEHDNLNRIKLENPTLRMSQWKQIMQKEWNKSPQNPMNQI